MSSVSLSSLGAEGISPLPRDVHRYALRYTPDKSALAPMSLPAHSVHFYEEEPVFLDSLSEFMGAALGTGSACIVIATEAHRQGLADRLTACGFDLPLATETNRYIALDAQETLDKFMVDGLPDEGLFLRTIEPQLLRATAGLVRRDNSVVAFGEMVALLWAEGKCEAAICLEQFWNKLSSTHNFCLRCAYPLSSFTNEAQAELFQKICAEHEHVIPAESYTSLASEDAQMRKVIDLQQKAQSLQAAVKDREHEIAQRQEIEKKLRRSEKFAKKIVDSSVDCIKILDLEGRLEYMSPSGLKALEIEDIKQILGHRWADFWKEEDRSRAEAAILVARKGGVGSFHGDLATHKGVQKSWDVKISLAPGSDGEVARLIVVSRDITELKFAQQALIQTEKLATAGRLAATVAHEINNPLEAVTNFIYLAMTSEDLPEKVRENLEVADRELARVAKIAQQTLGFYRDNSHIKWVNVAEAVSDVTKIYERKARNKQLKVEVSVDASLKVFAKQGELKQSLSNLLANAIDASHEGGILWLRARGTRNSSNGTKAGVRVTLADNGIGMAPDVQRRIFVPFFTTKQDVGTGIGLWVTKCLIEQQGGNLRFRSRQGDKGGTVISFFIPHASHSQVDTDTVSA